MRRLVLVLALTVAAACAPERPSEIETDLNQRVETAGLTGAALADAYIDRGILYLATKKPDAALADFDQAIATAPDLAEAHVWRGIAFDTKGDKTLARENYDRALAIEPDYWFAHGSIGMLLAQAGDDDGALDTLARAIELGRPHEGEYFVNEVRQSTIWRYMGRGPSAKEISTLSLSLSTSEQLARYRLVRASIYQKRNDQEAVLAELTDAVRLSPKNIIAQWQLAQLLTALGKCEEAQVQYDTMKKQTGIGILPQPTEKCPELGKT